MTERENPSPPQPTPLARLEALEDLDLPVGAVCDPDDPDCVAPGATFEAARDTSADPSEDEAS